MHRTIGLFWIYCVLFIGGCATFDNNTPTQQRQAILAMRDTTLAKLYRLKPDVKAQIASAPGYAVFSNANINIIFASFGVGHGVVKNNAAAQTTFMKMAEVGVGLGLGAKDFRLIFVFNSAAGMERFIKQGWAFGAQADAAAKAGDKGVAAGAEATIDNITIYQLTESGLALQATIKGTKFWQNIALNE